jgi:hypothetical protein
MSKQTINKPLAIPEKGKRTYNRNRQNKPIDPQIKNYVKQQMVQDLELKYIDVAASPTNVTTTGTIGALVNIGQGSAQGSRIGDELTMNKLLWNVNITAANSDVYSHARAILFQWHPNVSLISPTVAAILELPTATFLSALNWENRDQYTVLWDHSWSLTGTATVPCDKSDQVAFTTIVPKRKKVIFEKGSTAGGSNIIFLMFISDSAAAPFPTIQWYARLEYLDG